MRDWRMALARPAAGAAGRAARRWWQLARWPGVATDQPVRRPHSSQLIDRRNPCPSAHAHSSSAAMLAAMNLAGMTAVAQAQANDQQPTPGGRPPKARSGSPGTSVRSQPSSPPSPATPGDRPPKAKSESPGATRPTSQRRRSNRVVCPAGSWLRSGCWPPSWRWLVGWPCWLPGGPAAGLGSGTRPDHRHGHATRWGCRAHPAAPSPTRPPDISRCKPTPKQPRPRNRTRPQPPRAPPRAPPTQAVLVCHRSGLGAPQSATARSPPATANSTTSWTNRRPSDTNPADHRPERKEQQ